MRGAGEAAAVRRERARPLGHRGRCREGLVPDIRSAVQACSACAGQVGACVYVVWVACVFARVHQVTAGCGKRFSGDLGCCGLGLGD